MTPSRSTARRAGARRRPRAFSLIEMQIALAISAMLLASTLVALDTMFKGYEINADSASSHVISRIAVNRVMSLVRTGTDFGPMPADVLDNDLNPIVSDFIEFVSARDDAGDPVTIMRIEYRYPDQGAQHRSWGIGEDPPDLGFEPSGPGELWLVTVDVDSGDEASFMMQRDVRSLRFVLAYNVGPQLERATLDITVEPSIPEDIKLESDAPPQVIRLVASAMPRRIVQ